MNSSNHFMDCELASFTVGRSCSRHNLHAALIKLSYYWSWNRCTHNPPLNRSPMFGHLPLTDTKSNGINVLGFPKRKRSVRISLEKPVQIVEEVIKDLLPKIYSF